uniref:Hypothetical chloroplast RF54 n=1 Tax=Dasya binghamiae TaxID=1896963 RepID=A0A1C8XRV6_9FLOR|nr:hypothetical chloroplast RF54 [Dasya binghamiae]AOH77219.1 hypothetical chloroplast RF54 [Dasya binghamiae]
MYNYYFALASQNFLLNEEPLEEILRERTEYYQSRNKNIDFWFILNPNFINFSKFDANYINTNSSYAAIISLDKNFIKWLKLRIGFVTIGQFTSNSIFIPNNF